MFWTVASWVMSAVALTGTIINAERNRFGFVFWALSNAYMAIRFFVIGEYAQSLLFLIYLILAFRGLTRWAECEKIDSENAYKVKRVEQYISEHTNKQGKA